MDRRQFLGTTLLGSVGLANSRTTRRPDEPERGPRARTKFGYAAITWGGNDPVAIDEVSATGFRGIQLRASAVTRWGAKPAELKALLAQRRLTFVALSSGVVSLDPAKEAETIALHVANAQFLSDAGGLYLQVVDERPRGRAVDGDDYRRMGRLLTEIGRRTADLGIPLGYHNHMGTLGQAPDEVARVLDAADARFVKLELDIAHYQAAGGDPVNAISQHAGRILFVHLKDLQRPRPGGTPDSYRFVELGQGSVNVLGVLHTLDKVGFDGWGVVELDDVTDPSRTPAFSALMAKKFIESNGFLL